MLPPLLLPVHDKCQELPALMITFVDQNKMPVIIISMKQKIIIGKFPLASWQDTDFSTLDFS